MSNDAEVSDKDVAEMAAIRESERVLQAGTEPECRLCGGLFYKADRDKREQAIRTEERAKFLAWIEEERATWHGKVQAIHDCLDRLRARVEGE